MSKKTRRILAVLLAAVMMCITCGALAIAEEGIMPMANLQEGTGSITLVAGDHAGTAKYSMYRLTEYEKGSVGTLGKEKLSTLGEAFKNNPFWNDKISDQTGPSDLEKLSQYLNGIKEEPQQLNEFGIALWDTISKDTSHEKFASCLAGPVTIKGGDSYTVSEAKLGYYAIFDTTGVETVGIESEGTIRGLANLTQADNDITVYIKSESPTIDKWIVTDAGPDAGETHLDDDTIQKSVNSDSDDEVTFQIKGTIPDTTGYSDSVADYIYIISDKLDNGLSIIKAGSELATSDFKFYVKKPGGTWQTVDASAFKLLTVDDTPYYDASYTFQLKFEKIETYPAGTELIVRYNVELNEKAVIGEPNQNSATLTYSHAPKDTLTTEPSKATVYTYAYDFTKVADSLQSTDQLTGAKFKFYKGITGTHDSHTQDRLTPIYFRYDSDGKFYYPVEEGEDEVTNTEEGIYDTLDMGNVKIHGLGDGEYTMVESGTVVKGSEEYKGHPTDSVFEFTVKITQDESHKVTNVQLTPTDDSIGWVGLTKFIAQKSDNEDGVEPDTLYVNLVNTKTEHQSPLPETGGMGTILFTIIGLALMIGAASVMIVYSQKKRA